MFLHEKYAKSLSDEVKSTIFVLKYRVDVESGMKTKY